MSAPFQPGDVVVRVSGDNVPMPIGAVDRVVWCGLAIEMQTREPNWGIELARFDPALPEDGPDRPECWSAANFRKIDDEVEESFREQMRALGKPKIAPKLNPARHSREIA